MGIRQKRFTRMVDDVLRTSLQAGHLPSSSQFLSQLNQRLSRERLDEPRLEFRPRRDGETAEAETYNADFQDIHHDLSLLYETIVEQYTEGQKHLDQFETDRHQLDVRLNQIERDLEDQVLLEGDAGWTTTITETFEDMDRVDTAATDADVDLDSHTVQIPKGKNTSHRLDERPALQFRLAPSLRPVTEQLSIGAPLADVLDDRATNTWQEIYASEQQRTISGTLYADFDEPVAMNRIVFQPQTIQPLQVQVEITPDNQNWFALPYHEDEKTIEGTATWDFPSAKIHRVRFRLRKSEADYDNYRHKDDTYHYAYLFGLKHLAFYTMSFQEEALLQTEALQVQTPQGRDYPVNKVSLETEEDLPGGTSIDYHIALPPNEGDTPRWRRISPQQREHTQHPTIIDFQRITHAPPTTFHMDDDLSETEYELDQFRANGIRFYEVGRVAGRRILEDTDRLYMGKNTWGVQAYSDDQGEDHRPSPDDWQDPPRRITRTTRPMTDGEAGVLVDRYTTDTPTHIRATTGLYSEQEGKLITATPASTDPIAIYLNGEPLFRGIPRTRDKVTYRLQAGWNDLRVYIYTAETAGSSNGATVDLALDPRKEASQVFMHATAMTRVSLFDLRYNVRNNDWTKYATTTINDEYVLVVNHFLPGLDYVFDYDFAEEDIGNELYLKATFRRTAGASYQTPTLNRYRLRLT